MIDSDFIALYGEAAAQGVQVQPQRFWSAFSGPVGPDEDSKRLRLLNVCRTIPCNLREKFLPRLHSEDDHLAVGAWAELEVADLLVRSGLAFAWIDATPAGMMNERSLDLAVDWEGRQLHAEVTHHREESLP